jgi:hypothetical protein
LITKVNTIEFSQEVSEKKPDKFVFLSTRILNYFVIPFTQILLKKIRHCLSVPIMFGGNKLGDEYL